MRKIKHGGLTEVMDRTGLSGGLSGGKSIAGRGNSKCKDPEVGMNSAEQSSIRRPALAEQGKQAEGVVGKEVSG